MSEQHLSVRLEPNLKQLLFQVATARGEVASHFVTRCLKMELGRLGYLSIEECKALGLEPGKYKP